MFRQRLLTSLVLIPLVLLLIYQASYWVFLSIVLLLLLGIAVEWLQLIPLKNPLIKIGFIVLLVGCFWLFHYGVSYWLIAAVFCWCLILPAIVFFPASQSIWGHESIVAVAGLLLLPIFALSLELIYRETNGKDLIVYLLLLVWATDIGAYAAGKLWGSHKLIPRVSPGKTIEGTLGGLLLAFLIALLAYYYFKPQSGLNWFIVAFLTIVISMVGDLFISMLKRRCHLKDTGHLLPGHGGVLDRLDSLVAAAPLFYCGLYYFIPGR